ncbi:Cysteine protease StiP precursor [compost metagenome]
MEKYFEAVSSQALLQAQTLLEQPPEVTWRGWTDVESIQEQYDIESINLIKPGVGETTRVLLRRIPWKIIVDRLDNPNLRHILHLAEEKNVPVSVFPGLTYSCCGIIKSVKGDME